VLYRFTFPASKQANIGLLFSKASDSTVIRDRVVEGSQELNKPINNTGLTGHTREYFYATFSHYQTWNDARLRTTAHSAGDDIGFVTPTPTSEGEQIEVRIELSYISAEPPSRPSKLVQQRTY